MLLLVENQQSVSPYSESHVAEGVWLERTLKFSSVLLEDLNIFFNCVAYSSRGNIESYFKLQPAGQKTHSSNQSKALPLY